MGGDVRPRWGPARSQPPGAMGHPSEPPALCPPGGASPGPPLPPHPSSASPRGLGIICLPMGHSPSASPIPVVTPWGGKTAAWVVTGGSNWDVMGGGHCSHEGGGREERLWGAESRFWQLYHPHPNGLIPMLCTGCTGGAPGHGDGHCQPGWHLGHCAPAWLGQGCWEMGPPFGDSSHPRAGQRCRDELSTHGYCRGPPACPSGSQWGRNAGAGGEIPAEGLGHREGCTVPARTQHRMDTLLDP